MDRVIDVRGLIKSYGQVQAVQGLDFYVERGKLFAFLGPNGAGKSTTVEILSTALRADQGSAKINGYSLGRDDHLIRASIGVVFQGHLLDDLLTVKENLLTRGGFYGLRGQELRQAVQDAAEGANVTEFLNRPYGKLSGGQRRRADVARALVNRPELLFLDEPTTGLDAQTRRSVWQCISDLQKQNGVTVFLTTHYLEEAAEADYVIVIDEGKIAARGTPSQLKAQYAQDLLKLWTAEPAAVLRILDEMAYTYEKHADVISVNVKNTLEALPLLAVFEPHISGFEVLQGTMDDAFIGITGRGIRP